MKTKKLKCRIVQVSLNGLPSYYKVQIRRRFLFWTWWADSPDPDADIFMCDLHEIPIPAKRFNSPQSARAWMEKCAFPQKLKEIECIDVVAFYEC